MAAVTLVACQRWTNDGQKFTDDFECDLGPRTLHSLSGSVGSACLALFVTREERWEKRRMQRCGLNTPGTAELFYVMFITKGDTFESFRSSVHRCIHSCCVMLDVIALPPKNIHISICSICLLLPFQKLHTVSHVSGDASLLVSLLWGPVDHK